MYSSQHSLAKIYKCTYAHTTVTRYVVVIVRPSVLPCSLARLQQQMLLHFDDEGRPANGSF